MAARPASGTGGLTSERVWRALDKASFAIISYVTPAGEPRSSGVVYGTADQRLYVVIDPDSWKARHIAARGRVSVTVPVRRGGLLSLLAPIPPAAISFPASAILHQPGSPDAPALPRKLTRLLPAGGRGGTILEIRPEGSFVTYGVGVPLLRLADPDRAQARAPVAGTSYLALPEGAGPFPGVVVVHEASGLNDNIRDICGRFAAEGYAALGVDLF